MPGDVLLMPTSRMDPLTYRCCSDFFYAFFDSHNLAFDLYWTMIILTTWEHCALWLKILNDGDVLFKTPISIMDPLTFHPGNSKDCPCAAPPSDTDTLHWPGDLGTGFHLCKRKCLRTTLAVELWFISAFRKLKEWQHALLIYFDRLRNDSLQWPLFDGVLCVLNCEGKLDFIRENSFSIISSQVRRTCFTRFWFLSQ